MLPSVGNRRKLSTMGFRSIFVSVTKITNQKSTLIEKSKCMNVVHIFFSYMGKVVVTR